MIRPAIDDPAAGSLIREDLHGIPGAALAAAQQGLLARPDDPGHQLEACLAALAAGEPRRALQMLAGSTQTARITAALTAWCARMDGNWYPGGIGAESETEAQLPPVEVRAGAATEELLEQLVANGSFSLHIARKLVATSVRKHETLGLGQALDFGRERLHRLAGYADAHQRSDIGIWSTLAEADLCHRAGNPVAAQLLSEGRAQAARHGDHGRAALSHLIEGDWYAAPGSSPESLGWDLAPEQEPSPLTAADPDRAAACYDRAEQLLGSSALPRFRSALALRRAALLRGTAETDSRRAYLVEAHATAESAGDAAGRHLAAVHSLIADIDEGHLTQHALALGGGWSPPRNGPIAELLAWAATAGSQSWCVGLGRLVERCGDEWKARGSAQRARIAYLAARHLLAINPSLPSQVFLTDIAGAELGSNLAASALLRLERGFAPWLADTASTNTLQFEQKLHAAIAMVNAHRSRSRGVAAHLSAERMSRLREEINAARAGMEATLSPTNAPGPRTYEELRAELDALRGDGSLQAQADAARSAMEIGRRGELETARRLVGMLDVLVPIVRFEAAQRSGHSADADRWLAQACAEAAKPPCPPEMLPLVLVTAQRYDDAIEAISRNAEVLSAPSEFQLRVRAKDFRGAAKVLARLEADNKSPTGWHELLSAAEVHLELQQLEKARHTCEEAVTRFEDSLGLLLRDPDRLEACDQPDVTGLYGVLARTYLPPARLATAKEADRSFEAAERLRALTSDRPLGRVDVSTRLAWQQVAAEYAATSGRLLTAVCSTPAPADPDFSQLDALDGRLAALESELDQQDTGVLSRRTAPPAHVSAADLRVCMSADTLLLEYLAVGDDLLMWALTTEGVRPVRHQVPFRELCSLIRSHHSACSEGYAPQTRLAELLIEPFADQLRTHSRVVVVPFGPLFMVPFHALQLNGTPLALTHVVSYISRAAALLDHDGSLDRPVACNRALVVGDPAFAPESRPHLQRLVGSRIEASTVAGALGLAAEDVLVGAAASEAAVTSRLAACELLHLSSHGHLDELAPFASSLILADDDELTVADIAGLPLLTDLAVLTGCDTGRGNATLGGDLVGLTRSLLRSGVDRAVVSLWPVDDAVAPVTMHHFYLELRRGEAPAYALAAAQRSVYAMSADELQRAYAALGGAAG